MVLGYGLSLNALVESYTHNTIMIKESCQGRSLIVLINSESTHSFIDIKVIEEIKVTIIKMTVLVVIVAYISVLRCDFKCPELTWFM
jgi:hypothetical protein